MNLYLISRDRCEHKNVIVLNRNASSRKTVFLLLKHDMQITKNQ